jgi:hypothetical protein
VKERSYSSNNKNSDISVDKEKFLRSELGRFELQQSCKANFQTRSSGGRKHEDDESSKQKQQQKVVREEEDTVCRVLWRLAGFELLFFSEVSQDLMCGLAKNAVEITSPCFTF